MYPGDNEAGKRTVGPFSKTPLIRYPAGSPDFSPGPRAPLTQPSSQVSSLPLNSASPMVSPPWTSSPSFFHDSLPTWIPSPSSSQNSLSPSPLLLFGGSSSVPVQDIDFSIGFNQNPSFSPPRSNSMSVSGNTVPPRGRHRRAHSVIFGPKDRELILNGESNHGKKPTEELSDESMELSAGKNRNDMIQTNLGVKRRAENNIDPIPKTHKRNASKHRPYTPEELQKISTSKRLTQLASDPKKVRLILANRETARRSKQRKSQYIIDLETKVATLSKENVSLKTKLAISEKRCQALELSTRDSNKCENDKKRLTSELQQQNVTTYEEMQMNNQFDKPNMWNQSNINEFNQEQTNFDFENSNRQF